MDRWQGKVAIVTGASSGIGADIAVELVKRGIKVVAVARRVERIEALKEQVKDAPGQLHPLKGDVSKEQDILAVFDWTKKHLGGVDILINNAGLERKGAQAGYKSSLLVDIGAVIFSSISKADTLPDAGP
uniref:Farnesol dehydrogenase n=1 Tax=Timema tahoe TaxID=61484 RepID=A0A7R9NYM7_9NEOP|nr:unnamed protein product [Timema tahoe]